jgi:DNA helicase-2/ATP-dependent DNA helicase PcrA
MLLEAELTRRNIPFHKYGGLKFVEAAHVKDLMAFLRLAENPRDVVAGSRVLAMLPGIGPQKARQAMQTLVESGGQFSAWQEWKAPAAAGKVWPKFVAMLADLAGSRLDLPSQVHRVRTFYQPILEQQYDNPKPRARDLEQLEQIAARYGDRQTMLAEITLDPPSSTQDLAGPPVLDDDYLNLSTIHSAKGLEWDAVYVIHASDGNIPSDMATGSTEEIEEELRLFYVALTRAKRWLYVTLPLRYYRYPGSFNDTHGYGQVTRFLPTKTAALFQRTTSYESEGEDRKERLEFNPRTTSGNVRKQTKRFWS